MRIVLALAIALGSADARAGDLYTTDLDAVGLGQGGANVAAPRTLAAVWYNPAGLALGHGLRFELEGGLLYTPESYDRAPDAFADSYKRADNRVPFLATGLLGVSDDLRRRGLAVGLFAYAPSSSHYEFDPRGPQRYLGVGGTYALVFVHAAVAYELPGHLALGVALGPTFFHATQENVVSASPSFADPLADAFDVPITIRVDARPFLTANLGASYRPTRWLAIGASVMPPYDIHSHGTISFALPPLVEALATVDGDEIAATLHLPTIARAGVRVTPRRDLDVELAAVYEGWSRFRTIDLDPHVHVTSETLGIDDDLDPIQLEKRYRDVVSVRAGAELAMRPDVRVRAGAFYESAGEHTSYLDLTAPDASKVGVSVGATVRLGCHTYLDVAYAHIFVPDVKVTNSEQTARDVVAPENTAVVGNGTYRFSFDFLHVGVRLELER